MALSFPFDPTSSVEAGRLAWAIERYAADELTVEHLEATHEFDPGFGPSDHLRRFKVFRRPIDEVISCELAPPRLSALVRSGDDTAAVSVLLGDGPDQRILMMSLIKLPAPGVTTRLATESDGPTLRDLERRCAVETGGVSVYYDRGDDYFAQQRLMSHHVSSVAEYQGHVVGVSSDAIRDIRVAGAAYRATYRFHLRIDPAARGLGIMPALNKSQSAMISGRPLPITHNFIATENTQMLTAMGPAQNAMRWKTPIERIVISRREIAGEPCGRTATANDAQRVAHLLAESHEEEELAPDFDDDWVTERMERSPRDYSWRNVTLTERAMLGVWDSGLRMIRTDASGTKETRTATALDWGFSLGAEAEMESLLRASCAALASTGVDDLVIFTSPPSFGRKAFAGCARTIESFFVTTGGAEPTKDATHGIYVDPVYF